MSADSKRLYTVNELDNTVSAFAYDSIHGGTTHLLTVPSVPAEWLADCRKQQRACGHAAEIAVSPDCRFCYVSNRGHDSIAILATDANDGVDVALSFVAAVPSGGAVPWGFTFAHSASLVIVQNQHCTRRKRSNQRGGGSPTAALGVAGTAGPGNLVIFRRDHTTGMLARSFGVAVEGLDMCIGVASL